MMMRGVMKISSSVLVSLSVSRLNSHLSKGTLPKPGVLSFAASTARAASLGSRPASAASEGIPKRLKPIPIEARSCWIEAPICGSGSVVSV